MKLNKVFLSTHEMILAISSAISTVQKFTSEALCKNSLLKLQMVLPQSSQLVTREIKIELSLSNFIEEE